MPVKPIPEGYHTATPYLIVNGAVRAIEFYREAFGAEELMRFAEPGGKIAHAEIRIGDSPIMLADEYPEIGALSPKTLGGSAVSILLYVDDVDAMFERTIAAGARERRAVQDQFYGDRTGTIEDPFGHVWTLAVHTEDVPLDELRKRFEGLMKQRKEPK
jgi:PhnB protein